MLFVLQSEGPETVAYWNVSYPGPTYAPGPYEIEVIVDKSTFFYWPVSSQRITVNITGTLSIVSNLQHVYFVQARRAGSDGSMSASGLAGPGFNPQRGSKF